MNRWRRNEELNTPYTASINTHMLGSPSPPHLLKHRAQWHHAETASHFLGHFSVIFFGHRNNYSEPNALVCVLSTWLIKQGVNWEWTGCEWGVKQEWAGHRGVWTERARGMNCQWTGREPGVNRALTGSEQSVNRAWAWREPRVRRAWAGCKQDVNRAWSRSKQGVNQEWRGC